MTIRPEVVKKSLEAIDDMKKQISENTSAVLTKLLTEATTADITKEDNLDGDKGVKDTSPKEDETKKDQEETQKDNLEEPQTKEPKDGKQEETDWSEFEQFKDGDGRYDLTNASDEDVIKVFKKMDNTDSLKVVQDGNKVEIQDQENGADYIIDLGEVSNSPTQQTENTKKGMNNVKTIYEVALGYTDTYQSEDAMTTPPNTEVAPNKTRSVDAGVPTGSERPYGKPNLKAAPFTEGEDKNQNTTMLQDDANKDGKTCKTCGKQPCECGKKEVEEGATRAGVKLTTTPKDDCPNDERQGRPHRGPGDKKSVTVTEEQLEKIDAIFKENQVMKEALKKFRSELSEAVKTNTSVALALKVIVENTTTEAEKKDIVNRFRNEVKSVDGAKALYETISRELKKTPADTLAEGINHSMSTEASAQQINESKAEENKQNEEILRIQSLMNRVR